MYARDYDGRSLRFEPSGGLIDASLIMQDKETDSYWSIMTGQALTGEYQGTALRELPVSEKMQWKDWRAAHPDTQVLSIGGVEHVANSPYDNYFSSEQGFRGAQARDTRLPTKAAIYALKWQERALAIPHSAFAGGAVFELAPDAWLFLHRPGEASIYQSSRAYLGRGAGFEQTDAGWTHRESGAVFGTAAFDGQEGIERLDGFDTFWFNWSMAWPQTEVLQ